METMKLKDGRAVSIRRAQPGDGQGIIDLINQADTQSPFMTREPGEFTVTLEQEQALLSRQGEDHVWFLAVAGDQLVGMCNVDRVHTRARLRHRASLGLVVLKDWWGQGIGRQLMAHAIAWAQEQGFEQLELGVIAGNDRAQSLYRSLGFVETGGIPHAFKYQDGTYADDVFMVRALKG